MNMRVVRAIFVGAGLLSACAATPTPEPIVEAPLVPPQIEFAGVVTDVRTYAEHHEFTDAAGVVHALEFDEYRQVGEHDCCSDLVVLGTDAVGPFLATFPNQDGLPEDCYVENDPGIDRGSHIEILGILWRKAPGLQGAVPFGTWYEPGSRFCFNERGLIASIIPR